MYLKQINILGFKSFANKTTVRCSDGITAIVGPNGCGKTNILDALRWVLGEQKVSLLRGTKMEEVIFNGSRDQKPLGMSEVSLTIVNNRGVLPIEYTELQITRRLFRSGESEYLLNKVPCRLKDITELFYGTGMGAHSYSVIQQDMIESVISDKAEERRFLFEEAAGITKFKQRKKAALRKLEATENDFLRLNDIHAEVRTQVNSLNRQYKKAERYQRIVNEIKSWELYLTSRRVKTIETEKRDLMAKVDSLTDQISGKESELNAMLATIEKERTEQIELEQNLTAVGNQVYEISEKAHELENEISILREKRANARTLIDRNNDEIKALEARAAILTEQTAKSSEQLEGQNKELEQMQTALSEAEKTQAEADQQLLQARHAKDDRNKQLLELEGRLSSGRTEEDNLKSQEQELGEQIAGLTSQIESNSSNAEHLTAQLTESKYRLEDTTGKKIALEKSLIDTRQRIETLTEDGEQLSAEISELTASLEAAQARKTLLEEMMLHYEGYESGVVAAMEIKDRWPGISGAVAEKFVPVDGLEVALEAALGDLSRFIICDSRATAEQIISFLRTESKGKIGILVPDSGMLNPVVKRPEIDLPEFVGWMDAFVSTDESLRPLMQAVLARVAVYKEGSDPQALLERLPYGFKAVSTTGMVYSKNIVAGGSDDKFPLFRRKEKVDEQEEFIAHFTDKLQQTKAKKSRVAAELAELRGKTVSLIAEVDSASEEVNKATHHVNELTYKQQTLVTELARLDKERKAASNKVEAIRNRQYSLGLDFSALTDRKANLESNISVSSEELHALESQASAAQGTVSKLHVTVVETRSKIEQIQSHITHNNELKAELINTNHQKQNEIVEAEKTISATTERINQLEGDLKQTFEKRSEAAARQSELRGYQGELLEKVGSKEKQLKELRLTKEGFGEELHKHQLRLTTLDAEINTLAGRITDEYDLDIHTVEAACPDEEIEISSAEQMLREKKEKLKNFGAVNLLALEEYETAFEREKFLGEQLTDLHTAKKDLQDTINKINHTARQMFIETFNKVEVNFAKLFTDLFTGGEASISLVDPSDPLESDIHISARPRGKKLLSITMMSGGERALTAIALLFSLYMVKPSPFCILDEIDAPLDDANCRRFLTIIENFSKQTQFIIITHNKITMEAAHNLYGVTMEQPGISKLVAVKFNENATSENTDEMVDTDSESDETDSSSPVDVPIDESDDADTFTPPGNGHNGGNGDHGENGGNGDHDSEIPETIVKRLTLRMPSSAIDKLDE